MGFLLSGSVYHTVSAASAQTYLNSNRNLTSPHKIMPAAPAVNLNPSVASGDPQPLSAVGTLEDLELSGLLQLPRKLSGPLRPTKTHL